MRFPQFTIRFLLVVIAIAAVAVWWYSMPSLYDSLAEGLPVASGRKLRRFLERYPDLEFDLRIDLSDHMQSIMDDAPTRERLRQAGYEWARGNPDQFEAWMEKSFSKESWNGEQFGFYGDGFPDEVLRGAVDSLCEDDDLLRAYRLLDNDYSWDDGSHLYLLEPLKLALSKKSFAEQVAFFEAQPNTDFLISRVLWECEDLLVQKDIDGYVALMSRVVPKWNRPWFDMVPTRALAKADHQRCEQLLNRLAKPTETYYYSGQYRWLASSWAKQDPVGYAAWAEQQTEKERVWIGEMVRAWPDDDLPALRSWLWNNSDHLYASHNAATYFVKRIPNNQAIEFAQRLFLRVDDCDRFIIRDVFKYLYEISPEAAKQQLDAAIARTIAKKGRTNNERLVELRECQSFGLESSGG